MTKSILHHIKKLLRIGIVVAACISSTGNASAQIVAPVDGFEITQQSVEFDMEAQNELVLIRK